MARRVLSRHLRAPLPDEATQARYYRVYEGNRLHYQPDTFPPLTSPGLFDDQAPLELEVGCGTGEYLCELAHQNPNTNYVGLDISPKPLYRAVATAADLDLDNIRFIKGNIKLAYPLLRPASLQRVYLHFPNPHNSKRRFIKHQLFNEPFLDQVHQALAPHGRLSVMTDLGVSRKISTPHQVGVGSMWTNHLGKAGHRTHRRSNAAIALWVKRWPV